VVPGMNQDQLLELADQAREAGRLEDEEKIIREVVSKDQKNMDWLRRLADVYERRAVAFKQDTSDPEAAEKAREEYIKGVVKVYLYMADLAGDSEDIDTEEEMYKRILKHEPVFFEDSVKNSYSQAYLGLARVCAATDRALQAIGCYEKYVREPAGDSDAVAYLEMGRLYRSQKLIRQALSALQKAKKINPENPDIFVELAHTQMDNNKRDAALESIRKAIDKSPKNPEYHNVCAYFLLSNRYIDESDLKLANEKAREAVRLAREQHRNDPDSITALQALDKYYVTYRQSLEKMLDAAPESVNTRIDLARTIKEQAVVSQNLALYQAIYVLYQAEGSDKDNIRLLELQAELQFTVGRNNEAVETCRRLLNNDPQNTVAKELMKELSGKATTMPTTRPTGN
ncbi:MAG: tetratricopeptide repeat protein, partial [Planctomycetota bacterium]